MTAAKTPTRFARLWRSKLWLSLLITLVMGAKGIAMTTYPASATAIFIGSVYLPLQILLVIAYSLTYLTADRAAMQDAGGGVPARDPADDPQRLATAHRVLFHSFLLMLLVQPLLLLILLAIPPVAHPAALMACATAATGMATLCISALAYKR